MLMEPGIPTTTNALCKQSADYDLSGPKLCILVAGANLSVQRALSVYLARFNIHVVSAVQRQDVARQFSTAEPDLVLLNLPAGKQNELDLLREIQCRSDAPVIIATDDPSDEVDRIVALELGADDYVSQPFGLRELLARIRAVLRRRKSGRIAAQHPGERGCYRFDGWGLDRRTRRLTGLNGDPVALTKGEYTLLTAFLDAPQRPLSREYLLRATRVHEDVFDRSVDVQILRLRRKLERDSSRPNIIRTERGLGYTFTARVELL
jgi:two-component system, OmpR family, response regulator